MIFNSVLATISLLFLVPDYLTSFRGIVGFGFIYMTCVAMNDVLADSLMVAEAKKDPIHGSEDLQSLGFGLHSIISILSALIGAVFI
jgi:hypothetical protein